MKAVEGDSKACQWWAKAFVNTFVAWSNFVVLGCPRPGGSGYEPRVAYRSSADARMFADGLLGEVEEFASLELALGTIECEGKRGAVQSLVSRLQTAVDACYGTAPIQAGATVPTTALAVSAARLAVPETAGKVDPLDWLPEDQKAVFADLAHVRLPEHAWEDVVVACHRVPQAEEAEVAEKLLATSMATLIPEDDLSRDQAGRLMVGGLFCVAKNSAEDRLIYDRRPENATMPRLDWARLPNASCFTRMLLKPNQYVRGSGDDLRNYYYMLKLPENWVRFNGVGRRVDPGVVRRHGGDPGRHYRLCFRVLGMGDRNGCAVAQACHEAILRKHGVLDPQQTLVYGDFVPASDLWQGVYLDDLLVTKRVTLSDPIPLDGTFEPPAAQVDDEDIEVITRAEVAYEEAGLQRATHKAFRAQTAFKAWGGELDGIRGRVGAPLAIRREVWTLIRCIVSSGWATKAILQQVLGFVAFACQFRRELFCLQHRIYKYVSEMPATRWVRLPAYVLDELRSISLHLPFAVWKMRREIMTSLLATDATPTSGGSVRAEVPVALAEELWRRSEIKGAPVRLDRSDTFNFGMPEPQETSQFASLVSEVLEWRATSSFSFRQTSHINLQECRALRREVARLCSSWCPTGRVQVCFNDSGVCVGALAKGRSSSYRLNGIMRGMVPFLIMSDVVLALLWVETESNVADFPSRFKPLPSPKPVPRWLAKWGLKSRSLGEFVGLEVFGSGSQITAAHREAGLSMLEPTDFYRHEAPLLPEFVAGSVLAAIVEGQVQWLWLRPPYPSFSPLRNLDKGGPLRGPAGSELVPEVVLGNLWWEVALTLAERITEAGGYFFIEHPRASRAWTLRETELFCRLECVRTLTCNLGDYRRSPNDVPVRSKPIRLLTNAPWSIAVEQVKARAIAAKAAQPGSRAPSNAVYPWEFTRRLAHGLKTWKTGCETA